MPIRPNDISNEAVAERLRALLDLRGLRPIDLVNEEIGFSESQFSNWLKGTHPPQLNPFGYKLCDRLGVTTDFLYRGKIEGVSFDLVNLLAAWKPEPAPAEAPKQAKRSKRGPTARRRA